MVRVNDVIREYARELAYIVYGSLVETDLHWRDYKLAAFKLMMERGAFP